MDIAMATGDSNHLISNFSLSEYSIQAPELVDHTGYFAGSTSLMIFIVGLIGGCIQIYMRRLYRTELGKLRNENTRLSDYLDGYVVELHTLIDVEAGESGLSDAGDIVGKFELYLFYCFIYTHTRAKNNIYI